MTKIIKAFAVLDGTDVCEVFRNEHVANLALPGWQDDLLGFPDDLSVGPIDAVEIDGRLFATTSLIAQEALKNGN